MNAVAGERQRDATARWPSNCDEPHAVGATGLQRRSRLWHLDVVQLHDRYWAARGVCVVRRAQPQSLDRTAPAYLLLEPRQLALFDLPAIARRLRRGKSRGLRIAIHESPTEATPERFQTDDLGRITAIRRLYSATSRQQRRVLLTSSARIASQWLGAADVHAGWRAVNLGEGVHGLKPVEADGWTGQAGVSADDRAALATLLQHWAAPETTLDDVQQIRPGVWAHRCVAIADSARLIAPLWIGAGCVISPHQVVVGPQVLVDADDNDGPSEQSEPAQVAQALDTTPTFRPNECSEPLARRLFDIAFSATALTLLAPVMACIALAILIDDGQPIIFSHRRQTLGGRSFNCFKFRTMRRDAEALKDMFDQQNICDGPQFFIRNDPRETRVGRWLRRVHLDELPQFWNVLVGHMSVIGPRPSPEAENRYCPAWRHARLSVKSGVTGLWQVRRTRAEHTDFQEWIRYDTEYVRRRSWRLDLWIMWRTVQQIVLRK